MISPTSHAISRREPTQPGVVLRDVRLPVGGHELGHQRVGDVGAGDGPVVVDEDRERRLARPRAAAPARAAARTTGAGRAAPSSRARRPVTRPRIAGRGRAGGRIDGRRVSQTPSTMTAPPITCGSPTGSARNTRAEDDGARRHEELHRGRAGRPDDRIALNTNTLAMPAASAPEYRIATIDRGRDRRPAAARSASAMPSGTRQARPADDRPGRRLERVDPRG